MDIEYNIDVDDLIAWNLYYHDHSPNAKKQVRNVRITFFAFGVLFVIISVILLKNNELIFTILSFVLGIFLLCYGFLTRLSIRKGITKEAVRRYSEGKNNAIKKHQLSITPDKLSDVTDVDEINVRWEIIENIVSTDQHLFIVKLPSTAFIIPKRAFGDDATFNLFAETAKKYHQAASAANKTA
jgi:hypothetical protein